MVSTIGASAAGFIGAMARAASRASRSRMSCTHGLDGDRFASGGVFRVAAAGAFLGTGRQEKLAEGVGEDDCALVASLGDGVVLGGEGALPGDEPAANARTVGEEPRGVRDLDRPVPGPRCLRR